MPKGPKGHTNLRPHARFRVYFIHHVRKCARSLHLSLLIQTFLSCISTKDKVKIQFSLLGVVPIKHKGCDALLGEVPDSLVRLQRREFYRLATPKANAIKTMLPMKQVDGSIKTLPVVVADISAGGVRLNLPQDNVSLEVDEQFIGVSINLLDVGIVTADLQVRNIYDVTMPNGKSHKSAGCQFIKLTGPMMTKLIQRYIMQIERERKVRGD